MNYIPWMVILCDHKIKFFFPESLIFELYRLNSWRSRWCTGPFTHASHYWWKELFLVFGTAFDRSLARGSRGDLGGSGPNTHREMHLLHKIMTLQGVKLTIKPLEVGQANSPQKTQIGGMGRFPLYMGLAWL